MDQKQGSCHAATAAVAITVFATWPGGGPVGVRANSVASIDGESGEVTGDVRLPTAPDAIAASRGSVWIANRESRLLVRVDATNRRVADIVGLGLEPDALAAGADGAWVIRSSRPAITHVDPAYADATSTDQLPGGPLGSVADGQDSIWVAEKEFPAVLRIDKATGRVLRRILLPIAGGVPGNGGTSTIVVAGRSIWVGNLGGDISRLANDSFGFVVDATDGDMQNRIARFSEAPSALAFGAGELWIALSGEDQVVAVDPTRARPRLSMSGADPQASLSGTALSGSPTAATGRFPKSTLSRTG